MSLSCKCSFYILDIILLSETWFANFSYSVSYFTFLIVSSTKVFNFNEVQLPTFFFCHLYFWCHRWETIAKSKASKLYPMFSSKSCIGWAFILGICSILSSFLCMVWDRLPTSPFSMWICSYPCIIYWKEYSFPPLNYLGTLGKKQLSINGFVCFWTLNSILLLYKGFF